MAAASGRLKSARNDQGGGKWLHLGTHEGLHSTQYIRTCMHACIHTGML